MNVILTTHGLGKWTAAPGPSVEAAAGISGMVGWLTQNQPACLWMTRLEYMTLRVLAAHVGQEAPQEDVLFYKAAGWDADALDQYRAQFSDFYKMFYLPPNRFHALEHGQCLTIGGRQWTIVIGKGHSPEHAMLHCSEAQLLISGDQVLPTIASNVSVQPLEPESDPLSDWLESLNNVRRDVPDTVLVLPAHGRPFHGLHARTRALLNRYESGLERLLTLLESPKRAIDVFPSLYKNPIPVSMRNLATGESLAYLACLRSRGLAVNVLDDSGVRWWQASGAAPSTELESVGA